MLKVLIACEESQTITIAMRKRGVDCYSCDIQDQSGGHPEWHIKGDVLPLLNGECMFKTQDYQYHVIDGPWDLIIAHPPCTYLSNAGACRLYPQKGHLDIARYDKGMKAKDFFLKILEARCDHICIENPIPSKIFGLPLYQQIIQPYFFGEPYSKKTCLWLKNLPLLKPTSILENYRPYVSCGTSRNKGNKEKAGVSRAGGAARVRSKTFPGIAEAIADQWINYIKEDLS